MRGMSRRWNAKRVSGVAVVQGRTCLGGDVLRLTLLDPTGREVARVGCWDCRRVDVGQVQAVVGEIKKVMWWK
jgi:hypothetical protein